MPGDDIKPDNWKGQDKLAVVIETAALNESELGEYCRKMGLYPEQVHRWKEAVFFKVVVTVFSYSKLPSLLLAQAFPGSRILP